MAGHTDGVDRRAQHTLAFSCPWFAWAAAQVLSIAMHGDLMHAQNIIEQTYRHLRLASEPLTAAELTKVLHPAEVCSLHESGVLSKAQSSTGTEIDCTATRAMLVQNASSESLQLADACWLFSHHPQNGGPRQGNNCSATPSNFERRPSLLKRYPDSRVVPSGLPEVSSHLWNGVLKHGMPLYVVGDSLSRNLAEAARCEAFRAAGSLAAAANAAKNTSAGVTYLTFASGGVAGTDERTLATLHSELARAAANPNKGAVVLASFGHHFNNRHAPPKGFVEGFDVGIRSQYQQKLRQILDELEKFASHGPHCVALIATPSLQHFETEDGAYHESIFASNSSYGCRAATTPRHNLSSTSASYWRAQDMLQAAAARAKHVIVVPHHQLSDEWWDRHPGAAGPFENRTISKHRTRKSTTDCSHFCYSPFVYDHLWWAMRVAAHRGRQASRRAESR